MKKNKKIKIDKKAKQKKTETGTVAIKTSMYNEDPELMKLECRNCGAPLKLVDKTHAKCPYCGQKFLIDEATGVIIDVTIDYGDSPETRNLVRSIRKMLIAFFIVAAFVAAIILSYNIGARNLDAPASLAKKLSAKDAELLKVFCEDIFDKTYWKITEEELAQIRYIQCNNVQRDGEWIQKISYSFTDYKDCAGEEEFKATIEEWYYNSESTEIPSDLTMFTGLTRVESSSFFELSDITFSKDAPIRYIATDESAKTISAVLDPKKVEVFYFAKDCDSLEGIEAYTNLLDLQMAYIPSESVIDLSCLKACTKLKRLYLYGNGRLTGIQTIGSLHELESLYVSSLYLHDCDFLSENTKLRELRIATGNQADFTVLTSLSELRRLYFTDDLNIPATEVLKLAELKNLEVLDITIEDLESLEVVAGLTQLKELYLGLSIHELSNKRPVDLSILKNLTRLECVSIGSWWNDLECVEVLLNQPKLKSLRIGRGGGHGMSGFGLKAWMNVDALQKSDILTKLSLVNCRLVDAATGETVGNEFWGEYPQLSELRMDGCGLSDISFLQQIKELRICSLRENEIMDFSPLQSCRKLEEVDIYGNLSEWVELPADVKVNYTY